MRHYGQVKGRRYPAGQRDHVERTKKCTCCHKTKRVQEFVWNDTEHKTCRLCKTKYWGKDKRK